MTLAEQQLRKRVQDLEAELKLWKPLTPEEADRAFEEAEAIPISDEEIEALVAKVTDPAYTPTIPESVKLAVRVSQLEAENATLLEQLGRLPVQPVPVVLQRCRQCNSTIFPSNAKSCETGVCHTCRHPPTSQLQLELNSRRWEQAKACVQSSTPVWNAGTRWRIDTPRRVRITRNTAADFEATIDAVIAAEMLKKGAQ